MDKELLYIWLSGINGIGSVLGKRLINHFGNIENLYKAEKVDLIKVDGIGEKLANNIIKDKDLDKHKEILERCKKLNINIITFESAEYPKKLNEYENAPIILYLRGHLEELSTAVAIVGSRRCDEYGKRVTVELAEALSYYKIPIISGMAKGIDSYAHTIALNKNNYTIAVLGTGVDICYPKEHINLMKEIIQKGAVISQFKIGSGNIKENFIKRNEVISMLSDKVVVVQASENSGALYTARYSLKTNKDTYSVPGKINDRLSIGTNLLINEGANIYLSVEDILKKVKKVSKIRKTVENLEQDEIKIIHILDDKPKSIDYIKQKFWNIDNIDEKLLYLEMKGYVKQIGGGWILLGS